MVLSERSGKVDSKKEEGLNLFFQGVPTDINSFDVAPLVARNIAFKL